MGSLLGWNDTTVGLITDVDREREGGTKPSREKAKTRPLNVEKSDEAEETDDEDDPEEVKPKPKQPKTKTKGREATKKTVEEDLIKRGYRIVRQEKHVVWCRMWSGQKQTVVMAKTPSDHMAYRNARTTIEKNDK